MTMTSDAAADCFVDANRYSIATIVEKPRAENSIVTRANNSITMDWGVGSTGK